MIRSISESFQAILVFWTLEESFCVELMIKIQKIVEIHRRRCQISIRVLIFLQKYHFDDGYFD